MRRNFHLTSLILFFGLINNAITAETEPVGRKVEHFHLENCWENETYAKTNKYYYPKYNIVLRPAGGSIDEHPNELKKYTWSYSVSRTHKITEPFTIDEYFSKDKGIITFPTRSLIPGLYEITPKAIPKTQVSATAMPKCYIYVKAMPPVAYIQGGTYTTVPKTKQIVYQGFNSEDFNYPLDRRGQLQYQWKCNQTCGKPSNNGTYTVNLPSKVKTSIFTITLVVQSSFGTNDTITRDTEIMGHDTANLLLRCEKNCRPLTDVPDPNTTTIFYVKCEMNCKGVSDDNFEWSVNSSSFDYQKNTKTGRRGKRFIISPNALKPSQKYNVSVELKGINRKGRSQVEIEFGTKPEVRDCKITPKLETFPRNVTLSCLQVPDDANYYYEFLENGNVVMSGYSEEAFKTRMFLSKSNDKYTVRCFKDIGPPVDVPVKAQASDSPLEGQTIERLLSMPKMAHKRKGVAKFLKLIDEYVFTSSDVKDFKQQITRDLLNPRRDKDLTELIKLADSIYVLKKDVYFDEPHPVIFHFTSLVCARALKYRSFKIKTKSAAARNQTIEASNMLARCFDAGVRSGTNYDVLQPVKRIVIDQIPTAILDPSLKEDYPDYVDYGPGYQEHMKNMKRYTFNVITTTAKAAKLLATSTKVGEHNVRSSGLHSATVVAKDKGTVLARSRIEVLNCVLIPSSDLANSDRPFDVLMSTWQTDMMWWNQRHTRVATPIVSVQFWHASLDKQIKHFKAPSSLYLKLKDSVPLKPDLKEENLRIPPNYHRLSGMKLNPFIKINRIAVPKRAVLNVNFFDLSPKDSIDVVVTTSQFPTFEDFSKKTTITADNYTTMLVVNDAPHDVWCYVAVLPGKTIAKTTGSLSFNMSFTTSLCVVWDLEAAFWKPDCMPGKNGTADTIHCECKHFSVIAGYQQNVTSLEQEVAHEEIVLELQCCNIIFVTVAVTFGLYCLLVITVASRTQEDVFYLADNVEEDRYAYVMVVRTENAPSGGTTSCVTAKLTGAKRASEPHVLNYPDPKMRLLQKQGKDIFVLTTPGHLGDLTKLELWYNCEGASPSWFCRDILVYDMQSRSQWYFKIKTRFDVDKGVVYIEKEPIKGYTVPNLPFCKKFSLCNYFHTWHLWAGEPNFRFLTKLTTVLSNVLMMYTMVLILQGVPDFVMRDCVDPFTHFHLTGYSLFTSLLSAFVTFTIHVLIAWIFRLSDTQFSVLHQEYTTYHRYNWICWTILCVLIFLSMSFLIVYGFWVPYYSSLVWLVKSIIGILFDVIFLENIVIAVQTFFCKFRMTYAFGEKFDKFVKLIDQQRAVLYERFDSALLRPAFAHLYAPLKPLEIARRRMTVVLRRVIVDDLEDLFMYGLYNIILHFVVLYNKAEFTLYSKSEVESLLLGQHLRTLPFTKVDTIESIYRYLNDTLIPAMHPSVWYGNYGLTAPGQMIDTTNKVIGVARLRQHRIGENACQVARVMKFLNMSCWPEFDLFYEETRSFGHGWGSSRIGMENDRLSYIWSHQSQSETGSLASMGEFATYSGGGYVAFLGRTLYNSYANLLRLSELFWIDGKSRSVFVEFLTYNVHYNMFNAVRLVFEQSATGYVTGTIDINAVRMLLVQNEVEILEIITFALFFICVMLMMFKLTVGIVKHYKTFYKRAWLMLDLVINIMSLSCIVLFMVRMKMVEQHVKALEEQKHNDFINYFDLFYVEDFLTFSAACLICIATCRLWRFLRFGTFFQILERTLSMASFPLFACSLAFFNILTGFGLSGLMVFGNFFPELSTFMKIVATLVQLTLKPEDYPLVEYAEAPIGYAYFSFYLMLMQVILLIYIVIIIMSYTKARLEFSTGPEQYTVTDYIRERIRHYPKLIKFKFRRLRAGAPDNSPVTPKADEFRYANSLGIPKSKMSAMQFITSCVNRNLAQTSEEQDVLTRYEIGLMLGVCSQFVLKSYDDDELELFFKGHFEGENFTLVDEKQISKIAEFVEKMFEGKKARQLSFPKIEMITKSIQAKLNVLRKLNLQLKLFSCVLDSIDEDLTCVLDHEFKSS